MNRDCRTLERVAAVECTGSTERASQARHGPENGQQAASWHDPHTRWKSLGSFAP